MKQKESSAALKEYGLSGQMENVKYWYDGFAFGGCRDIYYPWSILNQALLLGDIKAMNTYMNKVALATFSCFDTGNKPSEYTEPEHFYHGFVLGLIVELEDRYLITSNRESGFGRYDVLLEPRCDRAGIVEGKRLDDYIIMEFKVNF